jgi:hypothetical protein
MPTKINNPPATLNYETPPRRKSIRELIIKYAPEVGWAFAFFLPIALIIKILLSGHSVDSIRSMGKMHALSGAWSAVALRAAIALVRRNRTWWSLLYLGLCLVLPFIADWAFSEGFKMGR